MIDDFENEFESRKFSQTQPLARKGACTQERQ